MNFKRNFFLISTLVATVVTLSGCKNKNAFEPYKFLSYSETEHVDQSFDNGAYVKLGQYSNYITKGASMEDIDLGSMYNIERNFSAKKIMEAEGEKKLLVIPVQFSDFTLETLGVSSNEYITNLEKAFFGSAKNNRFVSVSEYYNRSSYGKLKITGKVSEKFYLFPKSKYQITLENTSREVVASKYDEIIKWYKTEVGPIDEFKLWNDPNDRDIPIYLVYTIPVELNKDNSPLLWHYTFTDTLLSWSSYSCLYTLKGKPDAHTLIHEVGHLFGLEDYYPNQDEETTTAVFPQPTGKIDMMDCNVGDHTGFSKMLLDWVVPYQVKGSTEIKINALVNKGDLILINDHWNGTVFDEYYLIEFYTPTGLNQIDASSGNDQAKLPSMPGVKIYHVDARLAYYSTEGSPRGDSKFAGYCDAGGFNPNDSKITVKLAHNNTFDPSATAEQEYKRNFLYELQPSHLDHTLTTCASNIDLFHKGDSFDKFVFNKTNDTSYRISVSGLTYKDATIKIEKK